MDSLRVTNSEEIMLQFINGEFDVLLSTNIAESGLDIRMQTPLLSTMHIILG